MNNGAAERHHRITPARRIRARIAPALVAAAVFTSAAPTAGAQDPTTTTTTTASTTTASTTTTTVPASSTTTTTTTAPPTTTATSPPPTTSTPDATTTTVTSDPSTTTVPDEPASTTSLPVPDDTAPLDDSQLDDQELAELMALQGQYDELVADEARFLAEYEIRLAEVERLDAELAVLDRDISDTEREVREARAEVALLDAEQRANEAEQRETAADLTDAIERLRQQAVDAFVFGGSGANQALDALFDAGDAQTVEVAMTYADAVLDDQRATIAEVERLEAALEVIGARIETNRTAADSARQEVEELERQLERQRVGVQTERDHTDAERVHLEAVLAQIRARKSQYDQRLRIMEVESDNVTSVLARAQRDQPRAVDLPLMRGPIDPTIVSSGFGPRVHPIFGTVRRHNGLDISGDLGDPIRAVDAGVVVMAEMRNGFGNVIVIDHGDRIASLYAHQSRFEVEVGDEVARGELIGRVGSTGWSTGPHLHLEIRVAGVAVDPAGHLVLSEPLSCELLVASEHPIDIAELARRPDCVT